MKRTLFGAAIMACLGISLMVSSIAQSPLPQTSLTLTINYGLTLQQRVTAGRYDRIHPGITEKNFPPRANQASVKDTLVSLPPNRMTPTSEVLRLIEGLRLRPATLDELLAYDAANPTQYRLGPIAALGSSWVASSTSTEVPTVELYEGKRWLWLRPTYLNWPPRYRFLAVKK